MTITDSFNSHLSDLCFEKKAGGLLFGSRSFHTPSDLDKFLGAVGFLHSLVTIISLCLILIVIERSAGKLTGFWECKYSITTSFYIFSNIYFLNVLDGDL